MNIAVLGAGMVGRTIVRDLAENHSVTSIDRDLDTLNSLSNKCKIQTIQFDLSNFSNYPTLLQPFDFVVSAVPGFMGFKTLEAIINSGKNVVDISFFPEDAFELETRAKSKNITAIVDCGVAPGMSNLLLGYWNSQIHISRFNCMVGGLPKQRIYPFEYKAPFSPIDVIEEYTRPARFMENGRVVTKPAMSDPEMHHFEIVGTLESFNTDGLRSILKTMQHIPDMKERTLRYPGHIELIKQLAAGGFFNTEPITRMGKTFTPLEFTSALLFEQWKLKSNEPEFTLMQIDIEGKRDSHNIKVSYFLYDEYDPFKNESSMSRTTAFTCTAVLNLLMNNKINKKGIFPPELIGSEPGNMEYILNYLKERKVIYRETIQEPYNG